MLLGDIHSKIDNSAYLRIHSAKNERALNFLNRARILIIKLIDLQALFPLKIIYGHIIDQTEDVWQWNKTWNVLELFKPVLSKR